MDRILSYFREIAYRVGLRDWLLLMILAGALPAIALAIYTMSEQRELMAATQREEMLVLSKFGAALQYDVMQDAHDFLESLAREKSIQEGDWSGCRDVVRKHLQSHAPWYVNINVALPSGQVICNAALDEAVPSLADSPSFRDALNTGGLVVGNYEAHPVTGQPTLWFRFPVLDADGRAKAVISSSMDLRALNSVMGKMSLPLGAVMFVVDRSGTVLAHTGSNGAKWQGIDPPRTSLVKDIIAHGEGAMTAPGIDGVSRLWGVSRAGGADEQAIYAAVGLPMGKEYADATWIFTRQLIGLAVVTLLLIAVMWLNTKYLLLDKFSTILGITERLRQGDLSARTGMKRGRHELIQVGLALDEMAEQLEARDTAMHQLLEDTYIKSIRDPLTGLYNRAYLSESLRQLAARFRRHPQPVAVIMLDIDHFKRINDTYGHVVGDQVLREVSGVIAKHIRGSDIGCRYGGEEFLIILLEATGQSVRKKANELLRDVRNLALQHDGAPIGSVTVSLGIASNMVYGESEHNCADLMDKLVQAADAALYRAKQEGRNRVAESALNAWGKPDGGREGGS